MNPLRSARWLAISWVLVTLSSELATAAGGACAFPTGDRRRILWTGDDSGIIYNKGRGIEQMALDGSATSLLVETTGVGALDFDLSPDGAVLAYTQPGKIGPDCSGTDPEIRTMRIADRSPQRRIREPRGHFTSVRFSPDGRHVAANLKDFGPTPRSQVLVYDAAFNFLGRFDDWGGILWRGDGSQIGIFSWNAISVWDAREWTQVKSIRRPEGRIGQVAWSPDGVFLAAWAESEKGCDVDPSASELVVFDTTTWSVMKTLKQPGRCALELAWNPKVDSPVLAGFLREPMPKGAPKNARGGYRIALWNTRTWEEVGGSPTGQDRASDLVWSHSGERIAVGFDDVMVFELGDLGSPAGAASEPKSMLGEPLPEPAANAIPPAVAPPSSAIAPATSPPQSTSTPPSKGKRAQPAASPRPRASGSGP